VSNRHTPLVPVNEIWAEPLQPICFENDIITLERQYIKGMRELCPMYGTIAWRKDVFTIESVSS
jgi:hypothetical protein